MTQKSLLGACCAAVALSLVPAVAMAQDQSAPAKVAASKPDEAPKMTFGTWGVDLTQLDPAIRPGNDFFGYVNAKWIANNPIPAEFSRYGAFTMLGEKSQHDVRALVDALVAKKHKPGSLEQRIVDSYRSYLDQDAIDAAGLAPAQPYLTRIYGADSLAKLADLFGRPGFPSPIGAWLEVDDKKPDSYIIGIGAGGMGLPDRDYYLKTDAKSREIQEKYRAFLSFLLGKAGYPDPDAAAASVYALEYKFAELSWDRAVSRNRDLTYHKISRAELDGYAAGFPLQAMLDAAGIGAVQQFDVPQLPPTKEEQARLGLDAETMAKIGGGFPAMLKLLPETPLATLKAWMAARFLAGNADVLPRDIDKASFEFYGKTLRGQEEQRPRWKRAIDTVEGQLGEALGQEYVARYFPPENKTAMNDLVGNLRKALAQSLADNDWMSAATKKEAGTKLDQFTTKIGYPDKFKTYEGLAIVPGKPLENGVAAGAWSWKEDLAKLGGPVDRSEWFMLPQTVNAYYNPSVNEIVFPAAILQPPFFNISADPAVNYGAIGAVIGHEIGHGFDDQGAKSDGTGMLRDWWTEKDLAAFKTLGDKLDKQYSAYCPLDDGKTCVNGRLTLGENIGDLGGLSLAYRAYRMSLGGKDAPVIDGLTGDQRFFLAWAQVWRSTSRPDALRQQLVTDPHSPEQFRVNGIVRNMDAWYKAFNIQPTDKLYLPPEQRVHIW
ncbi:peptidase M13 family protein [Caenibius tardaugens NBRC 16725]|uniref:Peptidase M13 family protein n=1 Tax=Caenibius tardaugens NBRC 16725 TaxID=1219035 RepID=U2Y6D4_9SPHN|nr:M13 family metallopeptidase [Caenibius tardaugens]AZI36182.1 M13 family peptidase [Caenibius tardaugens NBRC 16725]GAD48726.1 peptidase M13 family protein [Caenibius tardaugens NBRC 16725]